MKKNVFKIVIASLIIIGGLVFYSCQKTEEDTSLIEQDYSKEIAVAGENFAKQLRKIITEKQFRRESLDFNRKISKSLEIKNSSIEKFSTKQLTILSKIALAKQESKSYITFSNELSEINKEILNLPKTEQTDLLYITSILYYGLREINEMAKEGLITGAPEGKNISLTLARLKRGLIAANFENPENGDNNSWWDNNSWLGAVWGVALIEPTPIGEAVAGAITGVVASYYVLTRAECIAKYVDCRNYDSYKKPCSDCLHYCIVQGNWNCQ